MRATRLVRPADAPALADLLQTNRDFLAPWEPARPDEYATEAGQSHEIKVLLELHEQGVAVPRVILDESGALVGRITLFHIERRAFQSANLGYWLGEAANGRGLATAAVGEMVRLAFDELGLHRVQAGTLLHNVRSQRVLERNGFVRFGVAPRYLQIAGQWQDHALYQVLAPGRAGPAPSGNPYGFGAAPAEGAPAG